MSELSINKTYEAIYALIDIQQIWRDTRPKHDLSEQERQELSKLIDKVRKSLDKIEGDAL